MYLKNSYFLVIIFIFSCQPVELISPVNFDNSNFDKISINAKEIVVNIKYEPIFSEENIEGQLTNPPINIIKSWIKENFSYFGNENKLAINIIDASIYRKEIINSEAKKYEEKTIYLYEVFFLVEYELYDDNDYIIANTTVENSRSTTSQKYISLNESELIINDLLFLSIKDFIKETKTMTNIYMGEYLN